MGAGIRLQEFSVKLHKLADNLLDYANGKKNDSLENDEKAGMASKIFTQTHNYFDKTVNNTGSVAALLDALSPEDKEFIVKLKTGEMELKSMGTKTGRR